MPHISFSELKNWDFCPFYHKLTYVDKIKLFKGNVYTAFGTALHETCEKLSFDEHLDYEAVFKDSFREELKKLKDIPEEHASLILEMKDQGLELASMILTALKIKFPGYKVFSAEEQVFQPIDDSESEYNYKGFLDLVVKTPDGKHHIIDWKSCSWGWDMQKRTDKITTYQLTYYKKFFCKKHNIEPQKVETYFGLLKRTAKKDNVEIFRVSSGERKIKNALNILNKAVYNISTGNHPKNRLNCNKCEFDKTKWCP
jgi:ATP-dependent exoDNAse (exonuclease V) beta subunit